jgi:hypothetical protein
MRHGAYPLSEQVFIDLIAPPILASIFWLRARGWARFVQSGTVSEETKGRQWLEFKVVLILGYFLMFGFTIYGLMT